MTHRERELQLQFLEETQDYLNDLESGLLGIGANGITQPIDSLLRAAHSIKGGAAMMSFPLLSDLAHRLEDFLRVLKAEPAKATVTVERLLLSCIDRLRQVATLDHQSEVEEAELDEVPPFEQLTEMLGQPQPEELALDADGGDIQVALFKTEVAGCLERLESILAAPDKPCLHAEFLLAAQELEGLGEMLELAAFSKLCRSISEQLDAAPEQTEEIARSALVQWWRSQALVLDGQVEALPTELKRVKSVSDTTSLSLTVKPEVMDISSSLVVLPASHSPSELLLPPSEASQTVRVSATQLSQFSDLFGELVIERNGLALQLKSLRRSVARLNQKVQSLEQINSRLRTVGNQGATAAIYASVLDQTRHQNHFDGLELDRYSDLHLLSQEIEETAVQTQEVTTDLETQLDDAERTVRGLGRTAKLMQSSLNQMQMRPVSDLVERFPRALREMSLQYGKPVALKVKGGSTLIDRTLIQSLNEPMLHLLRNAFAHGIEDPATRRAWGKPEQGTIEIRAAYRGNRTAIAISDDGGGIAFDKIRARARQMGFRAEAIAQANPSDLLKLLFHPGFSTAEQITSLSGRGVGLDVVHTQLKQVRGDIQIETQPGVGTTFTLTVPSTLSVMHVLLVETNGLLLAFPTNTVEEVLLLKPDMMLSAGGKEMLKWQGLMVPFVRLDQWLQCSRPRPIDTEAVPTINAPTVLMLAQSDNVAFGVDRYWGEQEVTVRQAEGTINLPPGFTGCTILGDGRVVPLVDPSSLLYWITEQPPFVQRDRLQKPAANSSLAPSTVMVVDDSITVRRFLAFTLEQAGYRVEQAKDGQAALKQLQAGTTVQAVICDIEMPKLDGYGFLSRMPSDLKGKIPVIMLTSRSGDKHRQLALSLGAVAYLSKPFKEQDLLQILAQVVE